MARGRPPFITLAKGQVLRFFESSDQRVFTGDDLSVILQEHRDAWRLPQRMTALKLIEFLTAEGRLRAIEIRPATGDRGPVTRYAWGNVSPLRVALSFRRLAFLSHASAAFVLGLTDVVPRRIYVNLEQTPKPASGGPLAQERIDFAFRRPQRESNQIHHFEESTLVVLNGKHSGRFEVGRVAFLNEVFVSTLLERTLVDLTVRPAYAGGVWAVLEAFRRARERASTLKLMAVLKRLSYIYPYHQALGFYMERAGFRDAQCQPLRDLGLEFDFYLAHGLADLEYDSRWRIHYPKGL